MRRKAEEIESDVDSMIDFLVEPRTLATLIDKFKVSRATVWRRLKTIESEGYQLVRVGPSRPTRYQILWDD